MADRTFVYLLLGAAFLNLGIVAVTRVDDSVAWQRNPVLVVGASRNPFSAYYSEILHAEGFKGAGYADLDQVDAAALASRDVVLLGETELTPAQADLFIEWVSRGGRLIAMRPDKQLAGLLGLKPAAGAIHEGYLEPDVQQLALRGFPPDTLQIHGAADLYQLNGAVQLAAVQEVDGAPSVYPALTLRAVGSKGGMAAAFTFDLARSIVYTRQGNPDWAGAERDGLKPIRSNDLFFGAKEGDRQRDWVDRSKIGIPQADEMQRLLANLILHMSAGRKPLPRLWYLPHGKKAALVLTGDDHANGGTAGRFDSHIEKSPAGCRPGQWECVRSTSYIYADTPFTAEQARYYDRLGFEVALHLPLNCQDFTPFALRGQLAAQLRSFARKYNSIPPPATLRTDCVVFSDWITHPAVEAANGIRLDTNYYYWPSSWVKDQPGYMTGSLLPMRFAGTNGAVVNNYQAATQITDESGQSFPHTPDTLLDWAVGPKGYAGFVVANIHTDFAQGVLQVISDSVVASAQQRGVPIISALQMLRWTEARERTQFTDYTWNGSTLGFQVALAPGAEGAEAMIPRESGERRVASVTVDGSPVRFREESFRGITYVIFPVRTGECKVFYRAATGREAALPPAASLSE